MKNVILFLFVSMVLVTFNSCQSYSAIKSVAFPDKDNLRIVTKDNQIYMGQASLPKITTKKIKMKTDDGQEIQVNSEDIAYVQAWHEKQPSENGFRLIYTPVKEYKTVKSDDGNLEMKMRDKSRWLVRIISEDNISLYFEHQEYDLKKDGDISGKSTGAGIAPSTWYYVMRAGEDMPTKIAYASKDLINSNMYLRAWGQKYFADCPALKEKIEEKKLKTNDIAEVVAFYAAQCK